jgi:hypothetical protein
LGAASRPIEALMPMTTSEITDVPRQRQKDNRPSPVHSASSISEGSPRGIPAQQEPGDAAERARDQQRADPPDRGSVLHTLLQAAGVVAERRVLHVEEDQQRRGRVRRDRIPRPGQAALGAPCPAPASTPCSWSTPSAAGRR